MKWKTILLLSLAALLIVGAFVFPPLLLRASVARVLNTPRFTDAAALTVSPAENTVEKLRCFTDPEAVSVTLHVEEDDAQLAEQLRSELTTLYALGAIPQELYDTLQMATFDGFTAERICMIQPLHLMFELYDIQLWGVDAQVVLDVSTGKVLGVRYRTPRYGLLVKEYDEALGAQELQAWASYLELEPGQTGHTDLSLDALTNAAPYGLRISTVLKHILLSDKEGNSVEFNQTYEIWESEIESYTWGAMY